MESQEKQYKYYAFISYSHKGNSPLAEKVRKTFPQSTLFAKEDMKWAIWLQRELESYHLPAALCEKLNIDHKQRIKPVFRDEDELGCGLIDRELNSHLDVSKFLIVLCSPNSAKPNRDGFHYINDEINHFINVNGADRVIPVIIDGVPNDPERECFPPALKKHQFIAIDATKIGKEHAFSNIVAKMLNLSPDELWERDKRRLVRRKILHATVYTLLLALLAFSGYWTWDWNRDYVERYADYVDKYGLPQGIFPLAKEDVKNRHAHYRFIYRGRKTLFGERVLREVMLSNSKGYYLEADEITKKFLDRPIRQQFEYVDDFVLDCIKFLDENGTLLEQIYYNGYDVIRSDKYQKITVRYDARGNIIETAYFDLSGKLCSNKDGYARITMSYDERGNVIKRAYYGIDNKPCLHKDGYTRIIMTYDERGNCIEEALFGIDGKPCLSKEGIAKFTRKYDERGNLEEEAYFGIDGKPCLHKDGYAKITRKYDVRGNCIEEAYFGIDGKPCLHKDGYAKNINRYDERNNIVEKAYFGTDGRPCLINVGFAKITMTYDEQGNCIEVISYNTHNAFLQRQRRLIFAAEIISESPAEEQDIKRSDIIIDYAGADWTNGINMAANIQRVRNIEKQLIFARKNPDGSFHIFAKTFPAGMMGITLSETWIDGKDYDKIMEAYKKFQEQQKK